ncbi:hypothetical protein EJB05_35928, partial [Eragrostis curvula]
ISVTDVNHSSCRDLLSCDSRNEIDRTSSAGNSSSVPCAFDPRKEIERLQISGESGGVRHDVTTNQWTAMISG